MLVGDDAVAHFQAGFLRELDVRRDAHTHDDGIGLQMRAVGEQHPVRAAVARGDALDLRMGVQAHSVFRVETGEHLGRLPAQDLLQRQLGVLEDRHLRPGQAGGGRRLQADPAAADHHDPRAFGEGCLEPITVADPAQIQHVLQVGSGDRRTARRRAGGEQQLGVRDASTTLQFDQCRARVDGAHGRAEQQVDVVVGVPVLGVDVDRLAVLLAQQIALGQRGPDVGPLPFVTDDEEAAVVAAFAQGLHGRARGQAASDDHKGIHTRHGVPRFRSCHGGRHGA